MFKQLLDLLKSPEPKNLAGDLRMAVAILLLEAAKMDDKFGADEHAVIARLLTEKFELTPVQAHELLSVSEEKLKNLVQLHPHTNTVFTQMDENERIGLVEMLWEVVYADDILDPDEDMLVRRISALVHVPDRERMLARQRVLAKKGIS